MIPRAQIVHQVRGRLRMRIQERRKDVDYFEAVRQHLEDLPGVESVRVNSVTGSVLLLHPELDFDELAPRLCDSDLFQLLAGPPPEVPAFAPLQGGLAGIDRLLGEGTGGGVDLRTVAFIVTMGMAIRQVMRGQIMVPAFTLMWHAMDLVFRNSGESGESDEPEGAADAGEYPQA
jgi:hypothetical protein